MASLLVSARVDAAQGVAVVATNGTRDDAFALARAVYVTSLRPKTLDEIRARVLGGDPAPEAATKEVKDLAALRAAVNGEDAASRQLLIGIAKQLQVQALLVVSKTATAPTAETADGGAEPGTRVQARLFVSEQADFDAARYDFDGSWQATVASVAARFPQASPSPAPPPFVAGPHPPDPTQFGLPRVPEKKEERPFYKSPWLWGAVAAAVIIGGIFFFASQDKSDDPIHVRMNVPR